MLDLDALDKRDAGRDIEYPSFRWHVPEYVGRRKI